MEKPEETYKAGAIQASVFLNVRKVKGKDVKIPSVSIQKRYQNKDGEWKSTNSLGMNDLPKAMFVLFESYDYLINRAPGREEEEMEETLNEIRDKGSPVNEEDT